MTNWPTTLYTAQAGSSSGSLNAGSNFPLAKNAAGKLRIVQAPYTIDGNEAANDYIQLTILKAGARVLSCHSRIVAENCGTTLTLAIGDASDTGRYANGLVLSNTTFNNVWSVNVGTDSYVPTSISVAVPPATATDQTIVKAKVLTAASLTAAKKILFTVAYVDE